MNLTGKILATGAAILPFALFILNCHQIPDLKPWQVDVNRDLKTLGARNWIIIAEPSFPVFSGKGVKVVSTDESTPKLVAYVLNALEEHQQVQPRIYTSQELDLLSEDYAPGIGVMRKEITQIISGRNHSELQHATLMKLMQDAGQSYNVLIIKSNSSLPYSSVFMELDSGYWDSESETALRQRLEASRPASSQEHDY